MNEKPRLFSVQFFLTKFVIHTMVLFRGVPAIITLYEGNLSEDDDTCCNAVCAFLALKKETDSLVLDVAEATKKKDYSLISPDKNSRNAEITPKPPQRTLTQTVQLALFGSQSLFEGQLFTEIYGGVYTAKTASGEDVVIKHWREDKMTKTAEEQAQLEKSSNNSHIRLTFSAQLSVTSRMVPSTY